MSQKWQRATRDGAGTQYNTLKRILSRNLASDFGREHHFAEIASYNAYQQAVPVHSYEELKPYIEHIAQGHTNVLTSQPVQQFALTSGSTQASKLIPYTKALVSEFQEGIDPWVYYLFRSFPRIFLGKAYWSVTPVGERKSHTSGGIAIGFDNEQQYFSPLTRWVLDSIMAVPSQLSAVSDIEIFRYITLRLLLQEKFLSWVSVWNPGFLTLLLDPLTAHLPQLIEDTRHGTLSVASEIEPPLRNVILPFCKRNPTRAAELASLYKAWQGIPFTAPGTAGRTLYEAIWPRLRLISCWAHGNAATALPLLKTYFPHAAIQPKGLLATEAFISFPFKEGLSALSLLSHFFEFEEIDEAVPAIRLAHELRVGQRYSIIVSTGGGFYRYRLNDIIEVVNFYHECPLIVFVGRQSKVVDVCGEKLNEEYARATVTDVFKKHELNALFWMMAPEWPTGGRPFYTLFMQFASDTIPSERQLQSIGQEIDLAMQESYHYEYARRLGQLDSCRLFIIAPHNDAFHTYLTVCTDLGQRLGDIKPTALHPYQEWSRRFTGQFV
jgi:hypothetical protein